MVINSGWNTNYSIDKYHLTGDTNELKYRCTTAENIQVDFIPNAKGLHVLDYSLFIGEGKGVIYLVKI